MKPPKLCLIGEYMAYLIKPILRKYWVNGIPKYSLDLFLRLWNREAISGLAAFSSSTVVKAVPLGYLRCNSSMISIGFFFGRPHLPSVLPQGYPFAVKKASALFLSSLFRSRLNNPLNFVVCICAYTLQATELSVL